MDNRVEAYLGKPLPRWVRITALVFGVLMVSAGMSMLLTQGAAREVVIPMLTGSMIIYLSGFEKRLWLDGEGVTRSVAFWGYRRTENIPWAEIADARVILNKGRRLYVLLHGTKKIWPLTYLPGQTQQVLDILREYLDEAAISIEQ
ncbi:hypothetical protein LJC40_05010 [Synergistaceae bacterium OttesenSCG-928-D05]|nr:hypothetical protein [Synergistaceae bacterium OttesenSCG-928-D05]